MPFTHRYHKPVLLHLTAGQVSDYKGAAALLDELPEAKELLADRGYDADWFSVSIRKVYEGLQSFLSMKRMEARRRKANALRNP
jgi:IS5 family transposase